MHTLRTRDGSSWSKLRSDEATRWPPSLAIVHCRVSHLGNLRADGGFGINFRAVGVRV